MTPARLLPHPGYVWKLVSYRLAGGAVRLVSGGPDGVLAWDPATGEQTLSFGGFIDPMNTMAVCPLAGRDPVLAVATDSGMKWFDTATGAARYGPTGDDTVWALALGPGAGTLFGAAFHGPFAVHRWDPATGAMLDSFGEHDDHIVAVAAFALPDGTPVVATGGWSETIQRWNPVTGRRIGEPMAGPEANVLLLDSAPLPDGRVLLVSAGSDGRIHRWDAATGEPIGPPIRAYHEVPHMLLVRAAAGPQLLTSGDDDVIRCWDALTGEPLGELGHGQSPILFRLNGTTMMAVATSEGVVVRER